MLIKITNYLMYALLDFVEHTYFTFKVDYLVSFYFYFVSIMMLSITMPNIEFVY